MDCNLVHSPHRAHSHYYSVHPVRIKVVVTEILDPVHHLRLQRKTHNVTEAGLVEGIETFSF